MSFVKFLKSKVFFKQIALAAVVTIILCFLVFKWLKVTTNHGDFVQVPELKGKTLNVVEIELNDNDLVMVVQDSANYNPKYPSYSVIDQDPKAGSQVKKNRQIFLTLNPSGYRKIAIPNIIERTYRQAKPTLESLGFVIGKITYVDNIGKDEVIRLKHKGATVKVGDLLAKTSKIDIVLGNGKRPSN
jgi:beta-lactam-binding protein with PASTA domain